MNEKNLKQTYIDQWKEKVLEYSFFGKTMIDTDVLIDFVEKLEKFTYLKGLNAGKENKDVS